MLFLLLISATNIDNESGEEDSDDISITGGVNSRDELEIYGKLFCSVGYVSMKA